MSFDWHLFLDLAKTLASTSTASSRDEAAYRTAGGRAYYSTYLLARDRASAQGAVFPRSAKAHRHVADYYRSSPGKGPDVAMALKTLRVARDGCDYDASPPITATQARFICAMAEATIKDIDAMP